jgi:hypothetical protein
MEWNQLPLICEVCNNRIADSISRFWTTDFDIDALNGRRAVTCICCEELANNFVINSLAWMTVLNPQLERAGYEPTPLTSWGNSNP